jgi:hypothetical protein
MRFCQDHWDRLREAIDARGLTDLVATSGALAAAQQAAQAERGAADVTTFDPLMSAHWGILSNAMSAIQAGGGAPLYLMAGDQPEDPVDLPGGEGKTWPRCPLCYLGLAHELTCTDERCTLPRVDGYAWMLDRAADAALDRARELGLRS